MSTADLPPELARVLSSDTAATWQRLAAILPDPLYLAGGTGIAARLHHRRSRDLDFFFHGELDLADLARRLQHAGPFAVMSQHQHTLTGVFSKTKVEVLSASVSPDGPHEQRLLAEPTTIAGMRVAQIVDLAAMKINAFISRAELRDRFDLMVIEQRAGIDPVMAIGLWAARFRPHDERMLTEHIVRSFTDFEAMDDDDLLPVPRADIERHWRRKVREATRDLAVVGFIAPKPPDQ